MGQSAWLSTSYPPYRAQREESMRGRQELAVTTGYHGAIIILSGYTPTEDERTSKSKHAVTRPHRCCAVSPAKQAAERLFRHARTSRIGTDLPTVAKFCR